MPSWCHRDAIVMPSWCHRDAIVVPSWCHRDGIVMSSWWHRYGIVMASWWHRNVIVNVDTSNFKSKPVAAVLSTRWLESTCHLTCYPFNSRLLNLTFHVSASRTLGGHQCSRGVQFHRPSLSRPPPRMCWDSRCWHLACEASRRWRDHRWYVEEDHVWVEREYNYVVCWQIGQFFWVEVKRSASFEDGILVLSVAFQTFKLKIKLSKQNVKNNKNEKNNKYCIYFVLKRASNQTKAFKNHRKRF